MTPTRTSRRGALKFLGLAGITTAVAPGVLLQACREAAQQGAAAGLATLTATQAAAVRAIQDAIIPRTDTPSASDVGSVEFLDTYITHAWTDRERAQLAYRLDRFAERIEAEHGVGPADATEAQVGAMLDAYFVNYKKPTVGGDDAMEIEGNVVERKKAEALKEVTGGNATSTENAANEQVEEAILYGEDPDELNTLLTGLRAITLESYFQSEQIGENVLNYLEVPGGWVGQYPMSEVPNGRAWSL